MGLRKVLLVAALAGSLLAVQSPAASAQTAGKSVAGGYLPSSSEWPWTTALIGDDGGPSCTGTLVAPKRVLTAAHCVVEGGSLNWPAGAHVGLRSLADTSAGARRNVTGIAVHPSYTDSNDTADVAVLFLKFPVPIPPAPLGDETSWAARATAMGWGHVNYHDSPPTVDTAYLKALDIITGSDGECSVWLGGEYNPAYHICTYDREGNDCITHGDSGGPLMVNDGGWKLIGVTSYYPAVHSRGPCTNLFMTNYAWIAGPTLRPWLLSVSNPSCPRARKKFKRVQRVWVKRSKQYRRAKKRFRIVCTG